MADEVRLLLRNRANVGAVTVALEDLQELDLSRSDAIEARFMGVGDENLTVLAEALEGNTSLHTLKLACACSCCK